MALMKKFVAFLICAVMVLSCCACADTSNDRNDSSSEDGTRRPQLDTVISDISDTQTLETDNITEQTDEKSSEAPSESREESKMTETTASTEKETEKETEAETEIETYSKEVSITEDSGAASVATADGLKYVAESYSSIDNDTLAFSGALKLTFKDDDLKESFNRVTLCYTSSSPVLCTLTYAENGKAKNDSFFLEAGDNIFSGLIESYIDGVRAAELSGMTIEPLDGKNAKFMLYNAALSDRYVYDNSTYYLENERFKVGLRLVWGGGITFVQDKQCEVAKLGNLINIHDAGRLVQQSYYGTAGNDEYQPGLYNETEWVYNPVQGGDQYWNHSRLIDIIVSENSVYVKAQPQDWSLDGEITPSYMENTYTVYDDRIVVDNRFVDFSGWEHRYAHQELPAFYTVSYLDRFSYYNGLSPWTDGELISHDGLPFCGGDEKAQCYFKLLSSNSETWCAWTNVDDDYGVGLYVPGADMLLAGRFGDGASKNPNDNSCSYVAPVNTLMIESFVPIEYSYMITAGSLGEIRDVFKSNRDFADNSFLSSEYSQDIRLPDTSVSYENIYFGTAEHNKYLELMNSAGMKFDSDHNAVKLIVSGADPQVNIAYKNAEDTLVAEDYGKIVIEYMVPKTNSGNTTVGELFLCTGETVNAEGGKSVTLNYIADGAYHTLEVELSSLDFWSGKINAIRFDFFNEGNDGDVLFVRSIKLEK